MPSAKQKEAAARSVLSVILAVPGCPPGATIEQITAETPLSERQVRTILSRLVGRGKVRRAKAQRTLDGKRAWHFYHAQPRTGSEK